MSSIKLFYSYLYVNKNTKITIKDNKIYDNKKFICGLLNVPSNKSYYKVLIERNLLKPKQSKKILITSYEKNNMKIFINFDVKKIVSSIKNNTIILEDKNIFFNMLKKKFIKYLNPTDLLFDKICLSNTNYKKIDNFVMNISYENPETVNISGSIFDIENKKLTNNNSITLKNINGYVIYTDSIKDSVKFVIEKIKKDKKKLYIIFTENLEKNYWCDFLKNYEKKIVSLKIINYSSYKMKTFILNKKKIVLIENSSIENIKHSLNEFDYVIFENTKLQKSLNSSNPFKLYISDNVNETVKDYYNKLNYLFNICIDYTKVSITNLYSLSKLIIKQDFFNYYKNKGDLVFENVNLQDSSIENMNNNLYNYTLVSESKKQYITERLKNTKCCICLEKIKFDELVITNCDHYYCRKCINNNFKYSRKCCICRSNVKNLFIPISNRLDIYNNNHWFYVGSSLNKIFERIKNNNSVIIYTENQTLYSYLKKILIFTFESSDLNYLVISNTSNLLNKLSKSKYENFDKIYLFIVKLNNCFIDCINIIMYLKNYFNKVYSISLNINNNFSNVIT